MGWQMKNIIMDHINATVINVMIAAEKLTRENRIKIDKAMVNRQFIGSIKHQSSCHQS